MDIIYQPTVKTRGGFKLVGFKRDYEDAEGVLEFLKKHTRLEGDAVLEASIEEVNIEDAIRIMYPNSDTASSAVNLPAAITEYKRDQSSENGYDLIMAIFAYNQQFPGCTHDFVLDTKPGDRPDETTDLLVCRHCGMVDFFSEFPELIDGLTGDKE
jgi:hypothetical protein